MSRNTTPETATELYAAFAERRSIRRYLPTPVPSGVVERLLDAATQAPSAHNRQPWRFCVIDDVSAKVRLAQAMGDRLRADRMQDGDHPDDIAADVARSRSRITGAPVLVVACATVVTMDAYPDRRRREAEHAMALQSVAMACQNLLLAAHAEGLGACWMCAPLFCPDTVSVALNLPADWEPQALITIGYPANAGKPRSRQPKNELVMKTLVVTSIEKAKAIG